MTANARDIISLEPLMFSASSQRTRAIDIVPLIPDHVSNEVAVKSSLNSLRHTGTV